MSTTRQWCLAVLAVPGALFTAGIVGAIGSNLLGRWDIPGAGMCAASAVVLTAYVAAPHHKLLFSTCTLGIGAAVAWALLEPSWYPENYGERAYQPTHLPLIATYIGGSIGLAIAYILWLKSGLNNSRMDSSRK